MVPQALQDSEGKQGLPAQLRIQVPLVQQVLPVGQEIRVQQEQPRTRVPRVILVLLASQALQEKQDLLALPQIQELQVLQVSLEKQALEDKPPIQELLDPQA
jgi:hypothetical protein